MEEGGWYGSVGWEFWFGFGVFLDFLDDKLYMGIGIFIGVVFIYIVLDDLFEVVSYEVL